MVYSDILQKLSKVNIKKLFVLDTPVLSIVEGLRYSNWHSF